MFERDEEWREAAALASAYGMLARYYEHRDETAYGYYFQKHRRYVERLAALAERRDPPGGRADRSAALAEGASADASPDASPGADTAPVDTCRVRAFHAVAGGGAADVSLNGKRWLQAISPQACTDYFTVPAGQYRVEWKAGGIASSFVWKAAAGASYTIAATGASDAPSLFAYADFPYAPPATARVRFAHWSPGAPALDVAAVGGPSLWSNVRFGQATGYVALPPRTYELEAREAGGGRVVLRAPGLKLAAGVAYTLAAVGSGDGAALDARLLRG
ncbi:DUF4397 domain-containing protein [Paenibacillus sp.]|uniref:DUF4397 domain-containing protein n=1 Tax=Paenibacillus sp. TaxID=58172 RepID=UPI002D3532C5|nr:DUF4397 domain-containing protein [Paenibacillus sp.]HZG85007.1 DUF4397 domain-containing protein [Paenibacillus sp.]